MVGNPSDSLASCLWTDQSWITDSDFTTSVNRTYVQYYSGPLNELVHCTLVHRVQQINKSNVNIHRVNVKDTMIGGRSAGVWTTHSASTEWWAQYRVCLKQGADTFNVQDLQHARSRSRADGWCWSDEHPSRGACFPHPFLGGGLA